MKRPAWTRGKDAWIGWGLLVLGLADGFLLAWNLMHL